jgi:hypothetical protein
LELSIPVFRQWNLGNYTYEKLILEILIDRYPVVRVNQEKGVENLVAEL